MKSVFPVALVLIVVSMGHQRALWCAPAVSPATALTSSPVEKYAKFEAQFEITGVVATNMYFPYDTSTPTGVTSGTGITVDALLLPPGESNWGNAEIQPCFYYQPVEEAGTGTAATFLPSGDPQWRLRFTPDTPGVWQYKIRATDAGGIGEGSVHTFTCTHSNRKGFVGVSPTDSRWMEFSDGTPFFTPLINAEAGNPLNGLSKLRAQIPVYAENGVRFVRWFPTGEGANYAMYPFGDWMLPAWGFGSESGAGISIDADSAAGKKFSFVPYGYSGQTIPAVPDGAYRLSLRAKVASPSVVKLALGAGPNWDTIFVPDNGGWSDYVLSATNSSTGTQVRVQVREDTGGGTIRVHSIVLQRDLSGSGDWGPNLLAHPDSDSYNYVDQRHAALFDEVMELSERYGVYHKLMVVHKNDQVLGRFNADGTINPSRSIYRVYSGPNQACRWYQQAWWRYMLARWSCYTAIHSLEFANENDPNSSQAFEAGWALADYFHNNCPRPILISNSFWHSFPMTFWSDPRMDYGDEHAYLNNSGNPPSSPYHSHSLDDSALSTRQCWEVLKGYGLSKPVLRGETGIFNGHWSLGWYPDLALDTGAVYEHKKLWTHVGLVGYQCDGQWNTVNLRLDDNWKMYGCYERYMTGEPVSNGNYTAIGTDLSAGALITTTEVNLRAWGTRDVTSTNYDGVPLAASGRVLLWIDNKNHTWRNVVDGVPIPAVSGDLTLQGLPQGTYSAVWWDTGSGVPSEVGSYTVGGSGQLTVSVSDLATDVALKLSNAGTAPVSVSFADATSVVNEAAGVANVAVTLSGSSSETVAVDYLAAGGTADGDGEDYTLDRGTLVFAAGQVEKVFTVVIRNDAEIEGDETAVISLANPVNATMGPQWSHTVVIRDSSTTGTGGWKQYK